MLEQESMEKIVSKFDSPQKNAEIVNIFCTLLIPYFNSEMYNFTYFKQL